MLTRDTEDRLLARCAQVGRDASRALSADEANVFRLAAQLVRSWYPDAAQHLDLSSKQYFVSHRSVHMRRFEDLTKNGLVTDLPRFRGMLLQRLKGKSTW